MANDRYFISPGAYDRLAYDAGFEGSSEGNYAWNNTDNWASNTGGTGGASVPLTSSAIAHLDANSPDCLADASVLNLAALVLTNYAEQLSVDSGITFIAGGNTMATDVSGIVAGLSNITTKLSTLLIATQSNGVLNKNAIQSNSVSVRVVATSGASNGVILRNAIQSNSVTIRDELEGLEAAVSSSGVMLRNATQSAGVVVKDSVLLVKTATASNGVLLKAAIQSNSVTIRDQLESLEAATASSGVLVKTAVDTLATATESSGVLVRTAILSTGTATGSNGTLIKAAIDTLTTATESNGYLIKNKIGALG